MRILMSFVLLLALFKYDKLEITQNCLLGFEYALKTAHGFSSTSRFFNRFIFLEQLPVELIS